ncbi:MAG: hypothetical protein KUG74_06720 [Rhodobacteraceae bacterium]|nr:hypothetical protein [Paracoccaceae bacterium]
MILFSRVALIIALAVSFCTASVAETILTVQVKNTGQANKTTQFSRKELLDLGQITLTTANDFVDGTPSFEGPLMRDLISAVSGQHTTVARLFAENDYIVEIPTHDFLDYDVVLALSQDGKRLSLRDMGPIWLIYPMSDHPELADPSYNNRLIWQLVRVELE